MRNCLYTDRGLGCFEEENLGDNEADIINDWYMRSDKLAEEMWPYYKEYEDKFKEVEKRK